jgi:hypothetical protein
MFNNLNPKAIRYFSKFNLAIIIIFTIFLFSCDRFNRPEKIKHKDGWKELTITKNGDSLMTTFRKDGTKKNAVTFRNGFHDGVGYNYYENGKVQNKIHYKEGYKNGTAEWFYKTGILYRITNYDMGIKVGIQKRYYESGELQAEIPYKNNKITEGLKEYKKDGSLITNYPKIIFEEIDKLAFENKLILKVYLSPKGKKTEYLRLKKIGDEEAPISLSAQTKNGAAFITYPLKPGRSIMEKVKIKVKTKTKLGNTLVLIKKYNLAAENRF